MRSPQARQGRWTGWFSHAISTTRTSTGGGPTTRAQSRSCPLLSRTTTPSSPQVATASSSPQHGPDRRQSCGLLTRMEMAHSGWSRVQDSGRAPRSGRRTASGSPSSHSARTDSSTCGLSAPKAHTCSSHQRAREPAASQLVSYGKMIYFSADEGSKWDIWRTPLTAGTPQRLTRSGDAMRGFESADGVTLVYHARLLSRRRLVGRNWRWPSAEGASWRRRARRTRLLRGRRQSCRGSHGALLPGLRPLGPAPRPARWR